MKDISVVVTGGCGFIGTNLVFELLKRGADVTVLDLPSADWSHLPAEIKAVRANILDRASLLRAFDGAEIVYHLAARTDLDGRRLSDYRANFEGAENVIEVLKDSETLRKFVLYSTQLVVGLFDETRFIDEGEPYRTKTLYGESKIIAEKTTIGKCGEFNIPYVIVRPTSVYGPWGQSPYRDFFRAIKNGRYFHVGKANNLVSLVYVENLVDLTLLLSVQESANNQIFFGNDFHPYTMREIVEEAARYYKVRVYTIPAFPTTAAAYVLGLFKLLGFDVPLYPSRLRNITANYCYDIQKSVRSGYDPRIGLAEGIRRTLDWYEQRDSLN